MFSNRQSFKYLFATDAKKVLKGLVDKKVDYVILDQLAFSSTPKFLYPATQKYATLFLPLYATTEPQFYLLKFDEKKAALIK